MKLPVRITLIGAFALTLFVLSPYSTPPAHALLPPTSEIILNSSTIQIVHNSIPNTDVLNASLDVTNLGDAGSCDGGNDDFLATGVSLQCHRNPAGSVALRFSPSSPTSSTPSAVRAMEPISPPAGALS